MDPLVGNFQGIVGIQRVNLFLMAFHSVSFYVAINIQKTRALWNVYCSRLIIDQSLQFLIPSNDTGTDGIFHFLNNDSIIFTLWCECIRLLLSFTLLFVENCSNQKWTVIPWFHHHEQARILISFALFQVWNIGKESQKFSKRSLSEKRYGTRQPIRFTKTIKNVGRGFSE